MDEPYFQLRTILFKLEYINSCNCQLACFRPLTFIVKGQSLATDKKSTVNPKENLADMKSFLVSCVLFSYSLINACQAKEFANFCSIISLNYPM